MKYIWIDCKVCISNMNCKDTKWEVEVLSPKLVRKPLLQGPRHWHHGHLRRKLRKKKMSNCETVITSSVKKSISDFFYLRSDRMKSLKRFVMFWMRIQRWEPSTSWPWLHMIHCDSIMPIVRFDRHVWSFTPPLWHKLSDALVPACYSYYSSCICPITYSSNSFQCRLQIQFFDARVRQCSAKRMCHHIHINTVTVTQNNSKT